MDAFCFPRTPGGAVSTRRHHQPLASTGRARCGCACNALVRCHRCCHWLGGFVRRRLRDAPNMLTTLNVPRVSACSRRAAQLEDIIGADRRSSAAVLLIGASNAHGVDCRASHAMTRRCNAPAPTRANAYGSTERDTGWHGCAARVRCFNE